MLPLLACVVYAAQKNIKIIDRKWTDSKRFLICWKRKLHKFIM